MINEIRFSSLKDDNPRKNFLSFREEIEQRIIELDEFYQLNITDARIGAFEKIRNRLANLLKINLETGNKITRKEYKNGKTYKITTNKNVTKYFSCDQVEEFEGKIGKRIIITKSYFPKKRIFYKFP